MKKFYLLPLFFLTLAFVSCSETEEPSKWDNWKDRNIAFADSIAAVYDSGKDTQLKQLINSRNERYRLFYKVLEPGTGEESPKLNSTVQAYYRGMYIDESVFAANPTQKNYTKLWKDLTVFDTNF